MIHVFDGDEITSNLKPEDRKKISERWNELRNSELKLREYMRKISPSHDEPFIGQYEANIYIVVNEDIEEFFSFFLKSLAQADHDIFIFGYDNGYVGFTGHTAFTILHQLDNIDQSMYANCMRGLIYDASKQP